MSALVARLLARRPPATAHTPQPTGRMQPAIIRRWLLPCTSNAKDASTSQSISYTHRPQYTEKQSLETCTLALAPRKKPRKKKGKEVWLWWAGVAVSCC